MQNDQSVWFFMFPGWSFQNLPLSKCELVNASTPTIGRLLIRAAETASIQLNAVLNTSSTSQVSPIGTSAMPPSAMSLFGLMSYGSIDSPKPYRCA